jgi:nicotinamidase-related amidase
MCVDTTVRAAFDLGLSCTLAHDACATRDLVFAEQRVAAEQVQTAYLAALGSLFAEVVTAGDIIARL